MRRIKYLEFLPLVAISMILYMLIANLYILSWLWSIVIPVFFGFALAYLINPLVSIIYRKTPFSWAVCVLVGYLLMFAVFGLLLVIIIPTLIDNIREFTTNGIPSLVANLSKWATQIENYEREKTSYANILDSINISSIVSKISSISTEWIKVLSGSVLNITSWIIKFIIALIISIYLVLRKKRYTQLLHRFIKLYLKPRYQRDLYRVLYKADRYFSKFLVGKIIDSAIIAIICFFGMTLLKLPYAVIISIIVGITNVIPYFGPFIGAVPGAVIILLTSPIKVIWFLIFIFLLQQFDGYILGPKILGDSIGVSPLWIIIGVVVGGGLMGPLGMIIGVPMFALINSEISYHMDQREKRLENRMDENLFCEVEYDEEEKRLD